MRPYMDDDRLTLQQADEWLRSERESAKALEGLALALDDLAREIADGQAGTDEHVDLAPSPLALRRLPRRLAPARFRSSVNQFSKRALAD